MPSLLFIGSLGVISYGNYMMLKNTEDIDIHYNGKIDRFSLSSKNTYTTSLIISDFICGLVSSNPIIHSGLLLIINPLMQWFLSSNTMNIDELNKHLQENNIYIDGLHHGKETELCLLKIIRENALKLGLIGALTYIISSLVISIFGIAINPVLLSVLVSSFMNVSFSVKSIVKSNYLKEIV
jgi:preprotein translocase subunit SecY